jgi:hypothetical protein
MFIWRVTSEKDAAWQQCLPPVLFFLYKTIDGKRLWMAGQVWRRRGANGRWEYRQDEETEQDFIDMSW